MTTDTPRPLIPLFISIIAVGISCLSFCEAHRVRILNEDINRPILQISDVGNNPISSNEQTLVRLQIQTKNTGKGTAIVDGWRMEVLTSLKPYEAANDSCSVTVLNPKENVVGIVQEQAVQETEIIAGLEKPLIQYLDISKCADRNELDLLLPIVVEYSDASKSRRYSQSFLKSTHIVLKPEASNPDRRLPKSGKQKR